MVVEFDEIDLLERENPLLFKFAQLPHPVIPHPELYCIRTLTFLPLKTRK
jgi:hypothetical protein